MAELPAAASRSILCAGGAKKEKQPGFSVEPVFYHDSTFHINSTKASRILNDTTGFILRSEIPAIAASAFPLLSDSKPVQSDRQTFLTPEVA